MNKINFWASLVGIVLVLGTVTPVQATIASPRAVVIEKGDVPTSMNIFWVNPDSVGLDHTNIYLSTLPLQEFGRIAEISGLNALPNQIGKCTVSNLSTSIEYYYLYLTAVDRDGNESAPTATQKWRLGVSEDITATLPVSSVSTNNATATSLQINWTNPVAEDFYRVAIYRSIDPTVPKVDTNRISYVVSLPGSVGSFIDAGLTSSTAYNYRLIALDTKGNESDAVVVSATTLAPIVPVIPPTTPPIPPVAMDLRTSTQLDYQASWINQNGSLNATKTAHVLTAHPGDTIGFELTLQNIGQATWYGNTTGNVQEVRIGTIRSNDRISKFKLASWLSNNRPEAVEQTVLPGATTTFHWQMTVPANLQPGIYHEYFRPVAEYTKWFGPTGIFWDIIVS